VRTADGRPLGGARVSVVGSDVVGTTSPNGAFALSGLPSGTYSLEVKAIGYAPTRVAVNLARTRTPRVDVAVGERVTQLESVVVQADRTKLERDYTGFQERMKRGMGRFITEEDIARRSAIQLTDALRTVPGLSVVPTGGLGYTVRGRGGCTPDLFLDGMRIMDGTSEIDRLVPPTDVAGIEVYNGAGTTPPQLQAAGGGSCGVVAVWTKRGRRSGAPPASAR
jgi:outer membrane cobalamin receptor